MTRSPGPGSRRPDEPLASTRDRNPWVNSLACAEPGRRYLVEDIVFGLVRDLCDELGCGEGTEIVCRRNGPDGVLVVGPHGEGRIERPYAWFVRVRHLDDSAQKRA